MCVCVCVCVCVYTSSRTPVMYVMQIVSSIQQAVQSPVASRPAAPLTSAAVALSHQTGFNASSASAAGSSEPNNMARFAATQAAASAVRYTECWVALDAADGYLFI